MTFAENEGYNILGEKVMATPRRLQAIQALTKYAMIVIGFNFLLAPNTGR